MSIDVEKPVEVEEEEENKAEEEESEWWSSDSEIRDALDYLDSKDDEDAGAFTPQARRLNAHGGLHSRPNASSLQPLSNRNQKYSIHIRASPLEDWEGRFKIAMSNSVTTAIRESVRDMAIGRTKTSEKADRATVEQMIMTMYTLYQKCKLVHGDLSEYNILYYEGHLYIIDVSQSVDLDHPRALDFLREDCIHVSDFFKKHGVAVMTINELLYFIVDPSITDESVDNYLEKAQKKVLERDAISAEDEITDSDSVQETESEIETDESEDNLTDFDEDGSLSGNETKKPEDRKVARKENKKKLKEEKREARKTKVRKTVKKKKKLAKAKKYR